jgi:hypothetical protein
MLLRYGGPGELHNVYDFVNDVEDHIGDVKLLGRRRREGVSGVYVVER